MFLPYFFLPRALTIYSCYFKFSWSRVLYASVTVAASTTPPAVVSVFIVATIVFMFMLQVIFYF